MHRDSRVIAAILAADVVGYARLMGADESGALESLRQLRTLFEVQVAEFGGRVFGSVGDSLMAEFHSAVNAVSAALALQARVAEAAAELPATQRMQLRIGVNLGDVIEEQAGVYGDAVNVAARLQALARPGGILIAGSVHDQVRLKLPARFVAAGTRRVKNVEEPIRCYEVLPDAPAGVVRRITRTAARLGSSGVARGIAVGVAVGVALALGLFWRDIPVPATGRNLGAIVSPAEVSPLPNTIAVLPFANMTGDPGNDYVGDGLADELQNRLSRVQGLSVAARRSAFAFRGKDVDVRRIADALAVSFVVEGSIRRQGDVVRVNASLVDHATGKNRWSDSYESSGDYLSIENDIGTQVLASLQKILDIGLASARSPARAGDITSYDLFLQGLSYLRMPNSARTLEASEQLFRRALAKEPGFARAQAGLCQVLVERFLFERVTAHVAAAEAACARAQSLDAAAYEVHGAVGSLSLVTGDAGEAEAAFRRALAVVPQSPDALIGLAAAQADAGDAAEAERTLKRAIEVQPRYASSHMEYGSLLLRLGRSRDAVAPYQRVAELEPDNPGAFNNLGVAYLNSGEFGKAAEAFSRSMEIEPGRSSYSNIGVGHYYHGRFDEAARMFRKATELQPSDHRPWGNLADALLFGGRPAEAGAAYARALELVEGELAINPKKAINQAQAAYYAIRLRRGDRARQCIANALAEGSEDNEVHYYVGLAELGLGNRESAIVHVRRARELGFPEVILKSAPELGDIRNVI